ncbi:hypothetical protein NQ314_020572 [Rhamnusium bicolor]|uniref:Uncharacterized protein n=1 Tax=Rhamnusium bicolor TaxID=1586634 RepID=A0AAV8WJS9_9CUCU|nr:hypothetical protein NQ314_020572 [Rhamnusium bicolor]
MLLEEEALYCSFTYELHPLKSNNSNSALWKTLEVLKSNPYNYRHDLLRHGICVPINCPKVTKKYDPHQELVNCYNGKFSHLGLSGNITNLRCDTKDPKYPVDWLDVIVAEHIIKHKGTKAYDKFTKSTWGRVLAAYSVPRNWNRLKTVNSSPDIERLRCIQGVRFYNMVLVILTHTVMSLFLTVPVTNTKFTENTTWLRHLGTGPNWNHVVGQEYLQCRKNWWTNLLYINNYIDPENMVS